MRRFRFTVRSHIAIAYIALSGVAIVLGAAWGPGAVAATPAKHPDFSGFWMLSAKVPQDKAMLAKLPPNTVVLTDMGAVEYPQMEFGGLKLKPQALEAAKKWNPRDDMSLSNACKAPSIVYAMQGPFPIEIFPGTEFIIIKLEYFDLVRIIFMDGRPEPGADYPHSKVGFSRGHWEGDTLVVETTHLEAATITNNGLSHSDEVRVRERFKLSADGSTLLATQEFEDPKVLDNRGARFITWKRKAGDHVYPYECDPSFALQYQSQHPPSDAPASQPR
jgi:hypothetical protein